MQEIAFSIVGGSGTALSQPVTATTPLPVSLGAGGSATTNIESNTPLGNAGTVLGAGRVSSLSASGAPNYANFIATAGSDQAGTLFVDVQLNGVWYPANGAGLAVAAGQAGVVKTPSGSATFRARYVNGATPQTAFTLASWFSN